MHIKQTHKANARPNLLKEHVFPAHKVNENKNNETPTAGYSPCRKSRFYKKMNGKINDVTL